MVSSMTKEKIFKLLAELKTHYSARNINFDLDDKYYELLFRDDLGLPEEYKDDGVVLPTARDIVDAGTNHLSTVYARFFRPIKGTSKADIEQAEMLRKFDTGLFYRTKMEASVSPWRLAAQHGCEYGMWCFETVYDPMRVPDEPEKGDEGDEEWEKRLAIYRGEVHDCIPIVIRAVHPRNVFQDPSENPQYIIIEETKTIGQVLYDWPEAKMALITQRIKENNSGSVTQVHYWSPQERAIFINGIPVLPGEDGVIEHDYGFIPYTIGFSGLGSLDKSSKPDKMAVGLLRHLRSLLRSESFAYSVYNVVIKQHSWPITFVSGPGAAALTSIKLKFGKIYEKPMGVTIEDYIKSPPPEIVLQHLQYTSEVLSASAAPRSVRGLPEAGVRSATDRAMIISEARAKYDTIMEQMQLSTAKVMANATKIAERVVPDDIYLWAKAPDEEFDIKIDKKKIKNHYTTFVEFTPNSPEEEARRHADMMNLTKTGIISSSTARRRYMSHLDPEAEDIKVEAEKLRNEPAIRQVLVQVVAQVLMGEVQRLVKLKALKSGDLANLSTPPMGQEQGQPAQAGVGQMPGQRGQVNPALSMPGGAQALASMMRQRIGQAGMGGVGVPAMPGTPEEQARRIKEMVGSQGKGGINLGNIGAPR